MNPISVLTIMGEMGLRYRASEINETIDYATKMLDNGRVIVIWDDDIISAVLFFSITNEPKLFLEKQTWEFKSHDPEGKIVYLEKLVSRGWNKKIRLQLESEIIRKYPNIDHAEWHRWGKTGDRPVISKRRFQNV